MRPAANDLLDRLSHPLTYQRQKRKLHTTKRRSTIHQKELCPARSMRGGLPPTAPGSGVENGALAPALADPEATPKEAKYEDKETDAIYTAAGSTIFVPEKARNACNLRNFASDAADSSRTGERK